MEDEDILMEDVPEEKTGEISQVHFYLFNAESADVAADSCLVK